MGDKPIEADCAIFGMLAQIVWNSPGSPYKEALDGTTCAHGRVIRQLT